MKKTLKNLTLSAIAAGAFMATGCGKKLQNEHLLPEVRENQKLVLDSSYFKGSIPLGYTLLTDLDNNGKWDVAESVYCGRTPGSYSKNVYISKDVILPRYAGKIKPVEPEFFNKYQ